MINVAICDDDIVLTGKIETMLQNIAKRSFIPIDTEVFWEGEHLADSVEIENSFDIIFLDIEMGQEDGITVARRIRKVDDYSGTLRATCPDFESHHSGEWEPYIPVIQSHLIGLYYIYFLYTVNTHLWCEYR